MELFFEEFEDYIFDRYGEKSYLKTMMEETLLPLKEALSEITSEGVMESLFGEDAKNVSIKKPLEKLKNTLESLAGISPILTNRVNTTSTSKGDGDKEKSLLQIPEVTIHSLGNDAASQIWDMISAASNQNIISDSEDKGNQIRRTEEDDEGGGGLLKVIGKLLGGTLLIGGLALLLKAFESDGRWKGTLKMAGEAFVSLSGFKGAINKFFGFFVEGLEKIGKVFTEGKVVTKVLNNIGLGGLMAKFKASTLFSWLGKGMKFLKRVPYLGTVIAFAMAYDRFKNHGDMVGGFMEIASGIANMFPGIGTGISIGIDMLIALRDFSTGGASAAADMSMKEQAKAMVDKIPGFIKDSVKEFADWIYEKVGDIGVTVKDFLIEKAEEFPSWLGETIGDTVKGAINMATTGIQTVKAKVEKLNEWIDGQGGWGAVAETIGQSIWDFHFDTLFPGIVNTYNQYTTFLEETNEKANNWFTGAVAKFIGGIEKSWDAEGLISVGFNIIKLKYENIIKTLQEKIAGSLGSWIEKIPLIGKWAAPKVQKNWEKSIDFAGNVLTGHAFDNESKLGKTLETIADKNLENLKSREKEAPNPEKHYEKMEKEAEMTREELVAAIMQNTEVAAEGSVMVGQTVAATAGSGGGGGTSIVNNNMHTTSDIAYFRRLSRERVR